MKTVKKKPIYTSYIWTYAWHNEWIKKTVFSNEGKKEEEVDKGEEEEENYIYSSRGNK